MNHEKRLSRRWILGAGPVALAEADCCPFGSARRLRIRRPFHRCPTSSIRSNNPMAGPVRPGRPQKSPSTSIRGIVTERVEQVYQYEKGRN